MIRRPLLVLGLASLIVTVSGAPVDAGQPPQFRAPSAIAERDCAPWDGPAFGVWIPGEGVGAPSRSWIYLRIWQSPETSAGRFTFPDRAPRQRGAVRLFLDLDAPKKIDWKTQPRQELTGTVRFTRVGRTADVEGELDAVTDRGLRLKGRFSARWIDSPGLVCG
jgi:hypothetical protein